MDLNKLIKSVAVYQGQLELVRERKLPLVSVYAYTEELKNFLEEWLKSVEELAE